MTPVEERRFLARVISDHAEEWGDQWARESLDWNCGAPVLITDARAIGALRRGYVAMLRRGGLDYAEAITLDEARGFPSFAAGTLERVSHAWLACGLRNGDVPCFGLQTAMPHHIAGMSPKEIDRWGRTNALWMLAKSTRLSGPED